jgi:DNA-binding MarR family transcriptional regulator
MTTASNQEESQSPALAPMLEKIQPWVLLSELYWMSFKLLDRRYYHLDISASQARVLVLLYFSPAPVKPSTVATLLFQETQSITGILHRIESRGWVERLPDPKDRRAVGLQLTEKGRPVAEEIVHLSEELYDDLFAPALSAAEKRQLETMLKKIRALGFKLPETDFKLRKAQRYRFWSD